MNKVHLNLGEKSYDIKIGNNILPEIIGFINDADYAKKVVIVIDENVENLFYDDIEKLFIENGNEIIKVSIPSGEKSKSLSSFSNVCDHILGQGIERKTLLIAIGGGVVGDLAGYVASSLLRGIDFIQVPTTLLSQVDSSVGGKVGINSSSGKNLIGAFYQPKLVIADSMFLKTLPKRQFSSGFSEVIKYGLIWDKEFFDYLENKHDDIFNINLEKIHYIVMQSCIIKAKVVEMDEKELGIRAYLNLGHTFGHAFENITGYGDKLYHGEAISIGMVIAASIALEEGKISEEEYDKQKRIFVKSGLPIYLSSVDYGFDIENIVAKMFKDKKVVKNKLKLIIPSSFGKVEVRGDVEMNLIQKSILQSLGNK